jgi:glycosyltransferase involved in cell wall biosynthesis
MLFTIFIPTSNRAESLNRTLLSLKDNVILNRLGSEGSPPDARKTFEVIVVDYQSTDDTFKVIEKYQKYFPIKLIHQKSKGLTKASNLALKYAVGKYFIRTDDDVIFSKNWLKNIEATFKINRKIGGVTGPTIIPKNSIQSRDLFSYNKKFKKGNIFWKILGKIYFDFFMEGKPFAVARWYDSGAFSIGSNYIESLKEPIQEVDYMEACNMAIRTNLLKKIGGFDETFSGGGDEYNEADVAFKLRNLGYKIFFNPNANLLHVPVKTGAYGQRINGIARLRNFTIFYFRHIKPNTPLKFFKFTSYLIFQSCYYLFVYLKNEN